MTKDTSISIRMDSKLKEQVECVLEQFGLNMTTVVNMLFRHIVREQEIPIPLTLYPNLSVAEELELAKKERESGIRGIPMSELIKEMELIVAEAEKKYGQ